METIPLHGGQLTLEELNTIFTTIPVEFDFIDADDIIRWSSANHHRLFKRTDADLGKHVLEVHPGHSQGRVKKVLQEMHSGQRNSIKILIHYHQQPVSICFTPCTMTRVSTSAVSKLPRLWLSFRKKDHSYEILSKFSTGDK